MNLRLLLRPLLCTLAVLLGPVAALGATTSPVAAGPAPVVGEEWTSRTAPGAYYFSDVTSGNGVFVASNSLDPYTSSDGVTWTARPMIGMSGWQLLTFGNGIFLARGWDGVASRWLSSTDGVTWTVLATSSLGLQDLTYGNGLFLATAIAGKVMTSADGVTWTDRPVPAGYWWPVTYGNGLFVVANYFGSSGVLTSPDGVNWTTRTTPSAIWLASASVEGMFVVVGVDSTTGGPAVMTSGSLTTVPSAPTGLVATPGVGSASISFTAGSMLRYWVYSYAKGTNTIVSKCRSTFAARSCRVGGLVTGTEYDMAVNGFFRLTGGTADLTTFDSATQSVTVLP